MAQTFHQLPAPEQHPQPRQGSLLALVLLFGFALFPRLWLLGFWIFSDLLGEAYSSWVIPALGFLFAPWTTLLYAWMWAIGSASISGWEWLPLGVGVLLDLWFIVVAVRLLRA
jgi:hypothetical protein